MIDKIIDDYLSRKVINIFKDYTIRFNLDFKYEYSKNEVNIYVKKPKYKESEYKRVFLIKKTDSILYLTNLKDFYFTIDTGIDDYNENNK